MSLLALIQPATATVYSLLSWVLQEWQPLMTLGGKFLRLFRHKQPDGIFEVLDYDGG